MANLIEYTQTDNDQAVFILIEDERCEINVDHFEECLSGGFTAMAAILQQDERVKKTFKSVVLALTILDATSAPIGRNVSWMMGNRGIVETAS